MVRTKADGGARKAVAAKAPRKVLASSGGGAASLAGMGSPSGKNAKYAGGNAYCPRPTPDWQKGIGGFLSKTPKEKSATDDKENQDEDIEMEAASSAGPAPSSKTSEECTSSSSSSQSPSKPASSTTQAASSSTSSPAKKNGLISDDSDEE